VDIAHSEADADRVFFVFSVEAEEAASLGIITSWPYAVSSAPFHCAPANLLLDKSLNRTKLCNIAVVAER
jgi:hypothetical protein